jgi:hypothetical protein
VSSPASLGKIGERFAKAPSATIAQNDRKEERWQRCSCERDGAVLRGDSRDEIATQVERHIAKAEGEGVAGDRVETLARNPARIAVGEMIRV